MSESGGLECFWSDLDKHPKCPHGPTLLFGRYNNGVLEQFYACSACRDRKLCAFYLDKDVKPTEAQKKAWAEEAKKVMPTYNHRRLFIRANESSAQSPEQRAYCHTCDELVLFHKRNAHVNHDLRLGLTDQEMKNPTTILKPLANVKKEAQYLFSKKSTDQITDMLVKAGAEQVLCIGAPRIHENITENFSHKMSSLLLDFDGRFHNFFGPLNYCWYNLFNHHFFTQEAAQTFKDFITQNNGKNTFVVCDPPFGGRVESISQTLKKISDQHKRLNAIKDPSQELKIIFVFPYFMESIMQRKSNPPNVPGGLKDLKMSDYKVDYENHPLFLTGSSGRKYGSPVRIFTNIDLKTFELPTEDGYKFCEKCEKWISGENKHCKKCKSCTSKDGRSYKHCNLCRRCVKPTWKHCDNCERCTLEKHNCGGKPKFSGLCFKCGESNHVEKDCGISKKVDETRKRKNKSNGTEIVAKKQKTSILIEKTSEVKNNSKKSNKKIRATIVDSTESNVDDVGADETNFVVENEETTNMTAKEAKKLRRMKKKAPIEWNDVENTKKRKIRTNGTHSAGNIEETEKPAETNGNEATKKKRPKMKSTENTKEAIPKEKTSKLRITRLKNVEKDKTNKKKIKRT